MSMQLVSAAPGRRWNKAKLYGAFAPIEKTCRMCGKKFLTSCRVQVYCGSRLQAGSCSARNTARLTAKSLAKKKT